MSYTPTEWATGDVVTADKLNKIEDGIASAGGGGILFANVDTSTFALNKTWQEIANADVAYIIMPSKGKTFHMPVVLTSAGTNNYYVVALVAAQSTGEGGDVSFESTVYAFKATSEDGYPTVVM